MNRREVSKKSHTDKRNDLGFIFSLSCLLGYGFSDRSFSLRIFWPYIASISLFSICVFSLSACQNKKPASKEQCLEIFNHLISLELKEMGFQDPALKDRWQKTLRKKYQEEISHCIGRPLAPKALDCVYRAKTAEEVSHECL